MSTENEIFSHLLSVPDLYNLYCRIGNSLISRIDLRNFSHDQIAVNNSVELLKTLKLIDITKNKYSKTTCEGLGYGVFRDTVLFGLDETILPTLDVFGESNLTFDQDQTDFFVSRNSVSLQLSGLVMLLAGFGRVRLTRNRIYINDSNLMKKHVVNRSRRGRFMTLIELKDKLSLQDELGGEAELAAIEFEKTNLANEGINKEPIRISVNDTTAGYDIASYLFNDSEKIDKFIEVKSCSDDSFNFFISKNEIDQAKSLRKSYFLYLYNRKSKEFTVICDPYDVVFNAEGWIADPSIYKIRKSEL